MKSGFQLYAEHMFRLGASSHIGHCYSQAHQVPYVFFQTSPKSSHTNHNPSLPKYPLDLFLGGRLFFGGLPIQLLSESLQKAAKLFFQRVKPPRQVPPYERQPEEALQLYMQDSSRHLKMGEKKTWNSRRFRRLQVPTG